MKMIIAILANKVINFLSKLITKKEGSVIGGYWALKLYPNILSNIKYPKYIIGITGSSGKTSSTELTYNILTNAGITVAYNKSGSNAINGITTLILNNCTINGVFKKEVLLMELDEKYMKEIFKYFYPTHLAITNITRDQPPRNIHPENIYYEITKSLDKNIHLILNEDDPLVKRIGIYHKGDVTYFGIDKNSYSIASNLNNIDASYCPKCQSKLKYSYYHYGHIGKYKCPKCDFEWTKPKYFAHNIDIENKIMNINNSIVHLPSDFLYSAYFTLTAFSMCSEIGMHKDEILSTLSSDNLNTKRLNIYELDNRKWQMLASKNENNLSYMQSIDYVVRQKGYKTIILGFENSSRRYSENDLSWIWDIEFEKLNDKYINKILVIGRFKYDVLNRLIYAGLPKEKLILVENINDIVNIIFKETKGNIYSMVCFDMEIILKSLIKEKQNGN